MDHHRRVGEAVAGELGRHPSVHAVLLGGSVARGEHQPASDVDLLLVAGEQVAPVRQVVDGLLVECISHSEAEWVARFDRPRTSWLYAFLEAETLTDSGAGARLQAEADQVRRDYVASGELKRLLATTLWHVQAKLDRISTDDYAGMGFWAAICIETIIDGLFTIHDVPLPAGARRLAYLDTVPLSASERQLLDKYLTGSTEERFTATLQLNEHLRSRLGPADHEGETGSLDASSPDKPGRAIDDR